MVNYGQKSFITLRPGIMKPIHALSSVKLTLVGRRK
jgi:hypothetical protein